MPRRPGSHAAETNRRMREAALRLFARHGYAAVSMRRIAAEVGVQAGALYSHTPDKQTLLFSLMQDHMHELLAARAALPPVRGAEARLEQFARFHIRFHLARPEAVFISYMELRNLEPENFRVIEGLRRDYETALETILRDGAAEGVFSVPDAKIAALGLIAMLNGVNTWYREGGRLTLEEVEAIYRDMARKAVAV
ncbi:TetR/AcrR family transcriptional regulator [Rhodosalinus halophilus]|uniref:TetR/AcrR family transcriptional regulator n=1 Tax=Rhodosalinus halophilus TaxID=2259333 RepID=A0A365U409_9RHOB|nr:TetR/AcrR family transcriptional regulator [Rhodosalinus halophilus]RBI82807.1 TetR/AcrR family transcriptional regulator [Rhodosalinus halophilus]